MLLYENKRGVNGGHGWSGGIKCKSGTSEAFFTDYLEWIGDAWLFAAFTHGRVTFPFFFLPLFLLIARRQNIYLREGVGSIDEEVLFYGEEGWKGFLLFLLELRWNLCLRCEIPKSWEFFFFLF